MRRWLAIAGAAVALVMVAAGCGGNTSSSSSSSGSAPASSSATATGGATVAVKGSKLGAILVDGNGRTLYLFEKDKGTTSSCYGACAGGWPPYATKGAPRGGAGASASLLGTTTRTDGKTEVTYHGHPLYYFAGDRKPGDTNGEGLKAFGAEWYVLSAAGNKVEKEGS
jgi:predicted lipoprotein with Yx(FWY)xxD motif